MNCFFVRWKKLFLITASRTHTHLPFIIQLAGVSPGCTLPLKNNAGFNLAVAPGPRVIFFFPVEFIHEFDSVSMAVTVIGPIRSLSVLSCIMKSYCYLIDYRIIFYLFFLLFFDLHHFILFVSFYLVIVHQ